MTRGAAGLSLLLWFVACGSDPLDPASGGTGGSAGTSGTSGSGGRADCPEGPGAGEPADPVAIQTVEATVVDQGGEPLAELAVFLCGTLVCSPLARTGSSGRVTAGFSEAIGPIDKPAFKYGDGKSTGRFAALLPASEEPFAFGEAATPRLPEAGVPFEPGATVESGGVRLTLAGDAELEISPIDFPEGEDRLFRAAELPLERVPPLLAPGLELAALYAFGPGGAIVCPEATVDLPNGPGAEPGVEFDVWVHGIDISEEFAPWGGWTAVGVARVSDSGERIELVEGGLPVLSALGLVRR